MILVLVIMLTLGVGMVPWRRTGLRRVMRLAERNIAAPPVRDDAPAAGVDITVVLELLDVATRAGAPVPRALDVVGTAIGGNDGRVLREVGAALVLGAPWRAAWDRPDRTARLDPVDYALKQAWEGGSPPGHLLAAASEQLRREVTSRARTAAGQLGVRLVLPLGLCLLPAFVLIGLVPVFVSLGEGLLSG